MIRKSYKPIVREWWVLTSNTKTYRHFEYTGFESVSITAISDCVGGWKWRGDRCSCGYFETLNKEEVEKYEHELSQLFHDVL